ncbi:hypothetical protein [Flavobacterium sp.]|jgi:hypothetical protein|uniref:hypothetical protein n=1 Tax=Flavobacterium sp. TaxID=239 RepID=UPI0037BFFC60
MKIVQASGQTCNQFWIYSNFIADAIENNEKFAIWIPDAAFEFFPSLLNSEYISYPLYSKKLVLIFGHKKYVKFLKIILGNTISLRFFNFFFNFFNKQSFIFADELLEKSKNRIKNIDKILTSFSPSYSVVSKVDALMNKMHIENEIIIGVHIRRGDYQTFEGGKYFYDIEQYAVLFHKLTLMMEDKKIFFYIASNEFIDLSLFQAYNCFYDSNCNMAEDLYSLSKVDFIIGPPSTFSAWAALYGNVPIYFVEDILSNFNISDFVDIKDKWF